MSARNSESIGFEVEQPVETHNRLHAIGLLDPVTLPFEPYADEVCPHCGVHVLFEQSEFQDQFGDPFKTKEMFTSVPRVSFADQVSGKRYVIYPSSCPHCHGTIVCLAQVRTEKSRNEQKRLVKKRIFTFERIIFPSKVFYRIPTGVPERIARDYREAKEILGVSVTASALMSRRCLQSLLLEHGFVARDLGSQIEQAIPHLPKYISANLNAIRVIGNLGAHPTKSRESDEILQIDPDEAGFLLQVLEQLLEFYYVHEKKSEDIRGGINRKLASAGKPPLK